MTNAECLVSSLGHSDLIRHSDFGFRISGFSPPLPFSKPPLTLLAPMDESIRKQLVPGAKVKVIQQIAARDYSWSSEVSGTVVEFEQKETGSWYAHSKNDKLWLDRLTLVKSDGEITTLNLDEFSDVKVERRRA
jgi:hypothetical protein